MERYDCIIIGGGPAGLSAALYASRGKLNTLVIEKKEFGGQAATTEELENYPGSMEEPTGPKIVERMKEQAASFGTQFVVDEVMGIDTDSDVKRIKTRKSEYEAKTIIFAGGAEPKKIGCPGEDEFRGKGVSYCSTCDADFFTDLEVVVVGGGDSAVKEAIYLTKFAGKVTVVHRRDQLRAEKLHQEKAFANPKINFIWDSVVDRIEGDGLVERVILRNVKTNQLTEYRTDGVFVFIGTIPQTEILRDKVQMDEQGYIITNEDMETNIEGIFAAGDCRKKRLRQVITAAADGAIAATAAIEYVEKKFE
ncbi:MAG: thioredoxin-disulfide reductase [Thermoanaerobacteraceae bacterium]|nr:thioredoxin-disulfide reductase [Thermoanaerobacteraceae bacterium]